VRQNLAEPENENAKPDRRQSVIKDLTLRAMTAGASAVGTSGGQQLIEGLAHLARMLGN
jgi:hypothetical protein